MLICLNYLRFWRSLYNRFDPLVNPTEKLSDALTMLKHNTLCLNEYSKLLEKVGGFITVILI